MSGIKTPEGWTREQVKRRSGDTKGKFDVYYYSPNKTKFRSRLQLSRYISANKLNLNIDDFDFKTVLPIKKVTTQVSKNILQEQEGLLEMHNETKIDKQTKFESSTPKTSSTSEYETIFCNSINENSVEELENSLVKLSEDLTQLKFQKEKAEQSLKFLESEAEETINKLQLEVKSLIEKTKTYKNEIINKSDEISMLKSHLHLENLEVIFEKDPSKEENRNLKQNENIKNTDQLKQLEDKINVLRRENNQLMESIQPYPLPDEILVKEIKRLEKRITDLEKTSAQDLHSYKEIIELLQKELEDSSSQNYQLK
ncbi:regulation of retrograde dense core granule transport [Homalodisca vitripennis]|nr:regulation of retrograde dense core granule transport [Homalodisca vitripennis]